MSLRHKAHPLAGGEIAVIDGAARPVRLCPQPADGHRQFRIDGAFPPARVQEQHLVFGAILVQQRDVPGGSPRGLFAGVKDRPRRDLEIAVL